MSELVNVGDDPDQTLSIRILGLIPVLVKAIQEQQTQIAQLQIGSQQNKSGQTLKRKSDNFNNNIDKSLGVILNQNDPNPFAEKTTISYNIPDDLNNIQLFIHDLSGKIIKKITLTSKGNGEIDVFASDLSKGIYSYTIVGDGQILDTKRMVVVK